MNSNSNEIPSENDADPVRKPSTSITDELHIKHTPTSSHCLCPAAAICLLTDVGATHKYYIRCLKDMIFIADPNKVDSVIGKLRRAIASEFALYILLFILKESPILLEEELMVYGLAKYFPHSSLMNANSLARILKNEDIKTNELKETPAVRQQIKSIIDAAKYYGLIRLDETRAAGSKGIQIIAQDSLKDLITINAQLVLEHMLKSLRKVDVLGKKQEPIA